MDSSFYGQRWPGEQWKGKEISTRRKKKIIGVEDSMYSCLVEEASLERELPTVPFDGGISRKQRG